MLKGEKWVIDHLLTRKKPGPTITGREWTERVLQEKPEIVFICGCSTHEKIRIVDRKSLDKARNRCKNYRDKHLEKWGEFHCRKCARKQATQAMMRTKANPEWQAQQEPKPSWQSQATEEELQDWIDRARETRNATLAKKTAWERSEGVRKQWETMSEEVKENRRKKISKASKRMWAEMTTEQRNQRVRNMIKGLPRSQASDDFRDALEERGLYDGFQSEVAISGFMVDEANHDKKLVIEFYGDFYHCNPRLYDENFYNTVTHKTAAQQWQYDRRRFAALRKAGYRVLVVWEEDWNKRPEKVFERVAEFIRGRNESSSS